MYTSRHLSYIGKVRLGLISLVVIALILNAFFSVSGTFESPSPGRAIFLDMGRPHQHAVATFNQAGIYYEGIGDPYDRGYFMSLTPTILS